MKYQSFIGLEVHIHLLTASKAFCSCRAAFGDEPNANVCPVCLGYPGVMPSLNAEALRMAAVVARALRCRLSPRTWFERKQYFYPDMPKNYQISQFASPVGVEGYIDLPLAGASAGTASAGTASAGTASAGTASAGTASAGTASAGTASRRIRIKECHLEEDAGKMIHAGDVTLVDYNRAGTPLLEIVTEPDFETGAEAEAYIQLLRRTVRYLGVCDGNMEEGSLRCDANVSVNLRGAGLGSKVEIKNLNSSRFVRLGLDYEIARQVALLEKGGSVRQETRLWNENRDQTEVMRVKESSNDYRFFPEPDIPPFEVDEAFLSSVEAGLVELPYDRELRMVADYGLSAERAASICEERAFADYYEAAVAEAVRLGVDKATAAERVAVWAAGDVRRVLNKAGLGPENVGSLAMTPARLASIVALVDAGRASSKAARLVFDAAAAGEGEPEAILEERGWGLVTDPAAIAAAIDRALAAEPGALSDAVAALARGDAGKAASLAGYLVGKALAASGGRADPTRTRRMVDERVATAVASAAGSVAGEVPREGA